jgi:hypothetical protein
MHSCVNLHASLAIVMQAWQLYEVNTCRKPKFKDMDFPLFLGLSGT